MKKTIALMLAMLFAVCAFATTAFADESTTVTEADTTEATQAATESTTNDDVDDGFNTTTTVPVSEDSTTTTEADDSSSTTAEADDDATTTSTVADVTATLAPGETAYDGQGDENSTTKKPAAVDTTIPSTGSGIVVPAIALAVLAAGTVAVIKTKKED